MVSEQSEIIVIGAGMVGAAAALSLARSGFQVTLIEAGEIPQWSAERYSLRVSAISASSEQLLDDIGVWQEIVKCRVSPYERMHVWDAGGSGQLDFDAAESGLPGLGYIVENDLINATLIEHIEKQSNISMITGSRLEAMAWQENIVQIRLDNGEEIGGGLLIAADGGRSKVRELCGINSDVHDYQQTGIVARVQTSLPHQHTAWQRFLATGPLAFLPLADGSCSIVWSVDQGLAAELLDIDEAAFCRRLEQAFEHRLGNVELLSQRAGFPLMMANAESYSTERVVLLGDAAHRVHPLAGQGVNLGFQDVSELCPLLLEAVAKGRQLADPMYLRKYARRRRAEASLMLAGMDGIKRIFASQQGLVCQSRNIAFDLINQLTVVKEFFVNRALGS